MISISKKICKFLLNLVRFLDCHSRYIQIDSYALSLPSFLKKSRIFRTLGCSCKNWQPILQRKDGFPPPPSIRVKDYDQWTYHTDLSLKLQDRSERISGHTHHSVWSAKRVSCYPAYILTKYKEFLQPFSCLGYQILRLKLQKQRDYIL